jgi:tetratricopeptide (TPR) repeat protein
MLVVLPLAFAAALTIGQPLSGQAAQAPNRGRRPAEARPHPASFERLERWLGAVARHTAGALDDDTLAAAEFSEADLADILDDLVTLRDRLVRARQRETTDSREPTLSYGGRTLPVSEVERLLGMDAEEARAGTLNRLLKRAAILHTDVAYFEPPSSAPAPAASDLQVMRFEDGRLVGYDRHPIHWEFARRLLDLVRPDPSADQQIRQWYVAAGRVMRRQFSFAHSAPHLTRARRLFADDADIQFLSGCLHEVLASPRVQNFYRSAARQATGAPVRNRELARAEGFLARVVDLTPGSAEARIRLGRVLDLRGQHGRAADELRRALDLSPQPALAYLGFLFLGDAEQALGHQDTAEAAYMRARGLFPNAQSSHLALAQLARRRGDRPAALAAAGWLFALPSDDRSRHDPWWDYHAAAWEPSHALITGMWAALQEASSR